MPPAGTLNFSSIATLQICKGSGARVCAFLCLVASPWPLVQTLVRLVSFYIRSACLYFSLRKLPIHTLLLKKRFVTYICCNIDLKVVKRVVDPEPSHHIFLYF